MLPNHAVMPVKLRQQAWSVVMLFMATGFLGYWFLRQVGFESAETWLTLTGLSLLVHAAIFLHFLPLNRPNGVAPSPLYPTIGAANGMSLARAVLNSLLFGFVFAPWPENWLAWLPTLLYSLSALIDMFDGTVARLTKRTTQLGEKLDMEYDGLGILIVLALVIWYGQLHLVFIALGLARYLFVMGLKWRENRRLPIYDLTESNQRRVIAGLQMGFLVVMLWPIVAPPATLLGGLVFGLPFCIIFLRDWLVVSNKLDPQNKRYVQIRRQTKLFIEIMAPLLVRLMLTLVILLGFWQLQPTSFLGWVGLVGIIMVVGGIFGRFGAVLLLFWAGLNSHPLTNTYSSLELAFILFGTFTIIYGTGPLSLWVPEKKLFSQRLAE